MTLLINQRVPPFDHAAELEAADRAQPISVESSEDFIILSQQDGTNEQTHCVLLEKRDIRALIEVLLRN